jgi:hypothetical protein
MRTVTMLGVLGAVSLVVTVGAYAFGVAHLGTAAATVALLFTAAALAATNQDGRRVAAAWRESTTAEPHQGLSGQH